MEGAITMDTILTSIGTFFTQVVNWVGDIIELIATEPLLLIMCVCMPIVGFIVSYATRLFNAN